MLKQLFTSNARIKLLQVFLLNPDGEFFIRELTRKLDEQINSIRRELTNLKSVGLLRSRIKNRKKFYVVNKNFVYYNELRSIIIKSSNTIDEVSKKLQKLGKIDLLIITGIFLQKNSQTDLFIVGDISKTELEDFVSREIEAKRPIRMSVIPREDFIYRLKINDKFVRDLIDDPENIVAINKLEKYFGSDV
jgi:predicted transcriptional regulator